MSIVAELDSFMRPKSVAVIGASPIPGRVGYMYIANLLDAAFAGEVYPVNPSCEEIRGIQAYASVSDIPNEIDLAIIAIRPSMVLDAVRECGEKGIKAILISSAGFSDGDVGGTQLQSAVIETARKHSVRIIGPNTQGYMNLDSNLMSLSLPPPAALVKANGLAFICQSALGYWDWILRNGELGLNKAVDLGNMSDVDHTDFLEYLGDDPGTNVVVLHIEGLRDGSRFMEVARRVTPQKPVIALKTGRSVKGAHAVSSHSGSLAGSDEVYDAAFHQVGVIRATDMIELADFTRVFASLECLPKGKRVGIISCSGGAAGLAADACERFGMEIPDLSDATVEKLRQILPPWANINNPIDLFPVIEVDTKLSYEVALEAFSSDPHVDAIILITITASTQPWVNAVEVYHKYAESGPPKPTVLSGIIDDEWLKQLTSLDLKGIPTFPTVERALRALAVACSRQEFLNSL